MWNLTVKIYKKLRLHLFLLFRNKYWNRKYRKLIKQIKQEAKYNNLTKTQALSILKLITSKHFINPIFTLREYHLYSVKKRFDGSKYNVLKYSRPSKINKWKFIDHVILIAVGNEVSWENIFLHSYWICGYIRNSKDKNNKISLLIQRGSELVFFTFDPSRIIKKHRRIDPLTFNNVYPCFAPLNLKISDKSNLEKGVLDWNGYKGGFIVKALYNKTEEAEYVIYIDNMLSKLESV